MLGVMNGVKNLLSAPIPVMVDSLIYLKKVKYFTVTTITGNRSAVAMVLEGSGLDVMDSA